MRTLFAVLPASMALAACNPNGSTITATTPETPALLVITDTAIPVATAVDRQDLVNNCIFDGGQMYTCECRAMVIMEKAPEAFRAEILAGARASKRVEMSPEMAMDPATNDFINAYAMCVLQNNDEIIRQQCVDSGAGDDSVCACRVNVLQRELGDEAISDLAREIKQHPAYTVGDTPAWWNDEEKAKYVVATATAASCVSSR